ncbi:hypothetical protein [Pseudoruminococcus massiliensis]|uniref:hypothetical protein n=1 Tax=Pseudoruminococcus massiliensis TaxID=2086583 RepID=UPI003AB41713
MKKLYAVIISILVLCGSVFMSGCSDFTFNPIGKWENIETKTVDGLDVEDPYDRSFYLIFRHDGTAYMTLGDTKLDVDFSYIYDDESVTITSKPQNSDNKPVSVKYKLKENGTVMESEIGGLINIYKRV